MVARKICNCYSNGDGANVEEYHTYVECHKALREERILYEDNHLITVNKLCDELSQKGETGDESLADDAIRSYLKEKYNCVSRPSAPAGPDVIIRYVPSSKL